MSNRITRNNSKVQSQTASRLSLSNSSLTTPKCATTTTDIQLSVKHLEATMLLQFKDLKASLQSEIASLKAQIVSIESKICEIDPLIAQLSELNLKPVNSAPDRRLADDLEGQRPISASSDGHLKQRAVVLSSIPDLEAESSVVSETPMLSACDMVKSKCLLLTNCAPSATPESVCHWIKKNAAFDETTAANLKCIDLSARRRQSGNLTYASFKLIVPDSAVEVLSQPTFWPPGTTVKEFVQRSPPLGFRRGYHRRSARTKPN